MPCWKRRERARRDGCSDCSEKRRRGGPSRVRRCRHRGARTRRRVHTLREGEAYARRAARLAASNSASPQPGNHRSLAGACRAASYAKSRTACAASLACQATPDKIRKAATRDWSPKAVCARATRAARMASLHGKTASARWRAGAPALPVVRTTTAALVAAFAKTLRIARSACVVDALG